MNGELIFGDGVAIDLTNLPALPEDMMSNPVCQDANDEPKGNQFIAGRTNSYWYDPKNWRTAVKNYQPLLHAEMVPSDYDTAVFPLNGSYNVQVNVESSSMKVRSIEIGGHVS